MLPRDNRLKKAEEFRETMRRGKKTATASLIFHKLKTSSSSRVGFVTSKAVGSAVTRNLVKRRLRSLTADWIRKNPTGIDVVIRAKPESAKASFDQLRSEVEAVLD